jgi:UDP-glucose 4-epimerase
MPLPFGGLAGRRSLLSLANLAAAVDCVLAAPAPLRRPLIVADPEPLTLPQMIAAMRGGIGRRPGLVAVPAPLVAVACRMTRREDAYRRLAGSLVADPAALRQLGWTPAVTTPQALAQLLR